MKFENMSEEELLELAQKRRRSGKMSTTAQRAQYELYKRENEYWDCGRRTDLSHCDSDIFESYYNFEIRI